MRKRLIRERDGRIILVVRSSGRTYLVFGVVATSGWLGSRRIEREWSEIDRIEKRWLRGVAAHLKSGRWVLLIGQVPFSSMSSDRAAELLEQQRQLRAKV